MKMSRRGVHDWDAILRDMSSGEDSDEGDSLNVRSVQKNARRVCELMRDMAPPGAFEKHPSHPSHPSPPSREVVPPKGMNPDIYRQMQRGILTAGRDAADVPVPSHSSAVPPVHPPAPAQPPAASSCLSSPPFAKEESAEEQAVDQAVKQAVEQMVEETVKAEAAREAQEAQEA